MNFPGRCYFCERLLCWFLGSWRDKEKDPGSWPIGLGTSGSIVLRLIELMSGGSRLGSPPVKFCCDGYTLQHLSHDVNKKLLNAQGSQKCNPIAC